MWLFVYKLCKKLQYEDISIYGIYAQRPPAEYLSAVFGEPIMTYLETGKSGAFSPHNKYDR